jgi:hypothetical protein
MANRIPLVVANSKLREIENGDTLDLTGNPLIVGGDLTPAQDSAYDLGSPTKKWKDLHLSGSTIFLGTLVIKDANGSLSALDSADGTAVAFSLAANDTDDLAEGSTNLYFTNARARQAFSASGDLSYNSTTGEFSFDVESVYTKENFDSDLALALSTAAVTSTNLQEGSNLYYTTARFDSDFSDNTTDDLTEGSTNLYYTSSRANSDFDTRLATKTTSDVSEGTNLYYTTARFDSDFGDNTTSDLTEGSNLYYTDARARAAVSVTDAGGDGSLGYDNGTGVLTYTGPSASEVRAHFSAGTGVTLSSGQISIGQAVGTTDSAVFASVTTTGNVVVGGNLQVTGTTTTVNSEDLNVTDNMIYMNAGESSGSPTLSVDVGWAANVNDNGSYTHVGMFRDATDDRFKVFGAYTPEPNAALEINTGHASFALADFQASTFHGNLTGNVTGNADTATALATGRTIGLSGDVAATGVTFDGTGNITLTTTIQANSVALGTDTTGNYVQQGATSGNGISGSVNSEGGTFTVTSNATNANTGSTIVFRDASGNFSAGTITAALSGNATTASAWATGRTITLTGDVTGVSGSFDGSGNLSFATALAANTVSSTELVSASTLLIKDEAGTTLKTIIGAGS